MGIEDVDDYKRFKLLGDPEAVLAQVEGHVRAHGLDCARVLIEETFAPACEAGPDSPS